MGCSTSENTNTIEKELNTEPQLTENEYKNNIKIDAKSNKKSRR